MADTTFVIIPGRDGAQKSAYPAGNAPISIGGSGALAVQAAAVAGVATGSAASGFGTLLYYEDWENATVGQPARTRTWGGVAGGVWNNPDAGSAYDEVSGSVAYAGSRSAFVRYYTDNVGGACQLGFDMGALYREVQISFRWLVPANYVHKASGNNKFFRMWPSAYGNGAKVGASMWRENDARSELLVDWNSNGDGIGPKDPPYSGFVTSADFGQWVAIEIYCKFESANNANDGVIRIKKNGTTIINATNVSNWYDAEPKGFRYGYLMGAANSGYDAITDFYFDNIEFRVIA